MPSTVAMTSYGKGADLTIGFDMTYLVNENKPKGAAHIWKGDDTACRMWSTGGMRRNRRGYTQTDTSGNRRICQMCQNVEGLVNADATWRKPAFT